MSTENANHVDDDEAEGTRSLPFAFDCADMQVDMPRSTTWPSDCRHNPIWRTNPSGAHSEGSSATPVDESAVPVVARQSEVGDTRAVMTLSVVKATWVSRPSASLPTLKLHDIAGSNPTPSAATVPIRRNVSFVDELLEICTSDMFERSALGEHSRVK